MKLIIKNSFLGKHVYDETGKEVCQISSHVMNPNQNILLIEQQKSAVLKKWMPMATSRWNVKH